MQYSMQESSTTKNGRKQQESSISSLFQNQGNPSNKSRQTKGSGTTQSQSMQVAKGSTFMESFQQKDAVNKAAPSGISKFFGGGKRTSKDIDSSQKFIPTSPQIESRNLNTLLTEPDLLDQDEDYKLVEQPFPDVKQQARRPVSQRDSNSQIKFAQNINKIRKQQTTDLNRDDFLAERLPQTFDIDKVVKKKDDSCQLCQKALGFLKKPRHNCYNCGACVCDKCSINKLQLSIQDPTKYRVCNFCFAIKSNKQIIIFYKEMDNAKKQSIDDLQNRKLMYKELLIADDKEIRNLKRQIEDQKVEANNELEKLADELKRLMSDVKKGKEQSVQWQLNLGEEEENAKQKDLEISELTKVKRDFEQQKQNIERRINEITSEVNQFIFQLMKLEMERKAPLAKPPRNENKVGLAKKVVPLASQKLEEVKKPLRNSSTAVNRQKPLATIAPKEELKDSKNATKTGFTEKPSDRYRKVKAADPFSGAKKHKTNFGYVYSSGGVPIRINHGSVRNNIQWDKSPQELDYDPLLINCFEGLLETEHPYALCAYKGAIELLQSPGASEKTIPIIQKLIMPLRGAFMSADKDIWDKGLEALKLLSQTTGHHLTGHIHILLAQLNKKMTTKQMREKILGVLNTIEEQGGKEALDVLRQKIPTYTSIYS